MHVCHVQKLHAARPDSVLKGSSGHALLCGQQWLAEGSPLHSTRDDSLAHRQAQRNRSAVLKIVNQNCCLPEIEIQEALLVKQITLKSTLLSKTHPSVSNKQRLSLPTSRRSLSGQHNADILRLPFEL